MKYADPLSCPSCRGPIGGVTQCPQCGFDLTSPAARKLWDVFVHADGIIAQEAEKRTSPFTAPHESFSSATAAPASNTDAFPRTENAGHVASESQTENVPGTEVLAPSVLPPAPAPRVQLTPGAILLGLGALSLVVAATIFVSLTWGRLGIGGRAAILLLLTCAFAAGLWFALKRTLPATSEALAFVVMGMVTINVFAAVAEGLFGLDRLHWGYPMLLWSGLILILSYWIQTTSQASIDRSLYTVQLILGAAVVPATFAAVSLTEEFWENGESWFMATGLPGLFIFLTFTHHLSQRLAWWMCLVWSVLWGILTTAYAWLMVGDSFSSVLVSGYAVIAVLVLCGFAIAFRYPRIKSWALSYALTNLAFMVAFFLVDLLGNAYRVNATIWWLVFLAIFVALLTLAVRLVADSSAVLRWIAAFSALGLFVSWAIPVLAFIADPPQMASSFVSMGNSASWLPASAVIVGTVVLVGFSSLIADALVRDFVALPGTILRTLEALAIVVGIATALGTLAAPTLLIAAIFLLGAIAIVSSTLR